MIWTTAAPAIVTAFVSSLVEAVEALTIVLAVASVRGWRPAGLGAIAGLALLAAIVLALGPLLDAIPLQALQLLIGVLLLLFGMRWLRKAILRAAGVIALHDAGPLLTRLRNCASRRSGSRSALTGSRALRASRPSCWRGLKLCSS